MKKNHMLSLLAAFVFLFTAHAPVAARAEGGWDGTDDAVPDGQQYPFVSVSDEEDGSFLYEDDFSGLFLPPDDESDPEAENNPAVKPSAGEITPLPDDDGSEQNESEFVLDGTTLVKYQGNDSYVDVPNGVTVIGSGAFAGKKGICSVYLPDSVKKILDGAFQNCSNLLSVTISANSKLAWIGDNAFAGCPHLNNSFAISVEYISDSAFPQNPKYTPTPRCTPTLKPTATMKPAPTKLAFPSDNQGAYTGTAYPGSLTITLQPENVYAAEGTFVSFMTVAEGPGNIQYQWMRSKDGVEWVRIENNSQAFDGAATNVLSFTATLARSNYLFKCVVSDGVNTVESMVVSVVVTSHGAGLFGGDPWGETQSPSPAPSDSDDRLEGSVPYVKARQISETSAEIKWSKTPSAIGYELYRYALNEARNEDFSLVGTFTDTTYIDTNLNFSEYTYTYSVRALLSAPADRDPVTTDYYPAAEALALTAPAGITARQETETAARITWEASPLATSYILWRKTNDDEHATILSDSLTVTEYVDRGLDFLNNTYRYAVSAVMTVPGSDKAIRAHSKYTQVAEYLTAGKEITVDNVVYTITSDGAVVTAYRGNASSLTIPQKINNKFTVVAIGANVFWGNKTLKTIKLPSTIRVIETGAFGYCAAVIDQ